MGIVVEKTFEYIREIEKEGHKGFSLFFFFALSSPSYPTTYQNLEDLKLSSDIISLDILSASMISEVTIDIFTMLGNFFFTINIVMRLRRSLPILFYVF